jgi:hypothetical protein
MQFPVFGREKKAFTPSPFRERVGVRMKYIIENMFICPLTLILSQGRGKKGKNKLKHE